MCCASASNSPLGVVFRFHFFAPDARYVAQVIFVRRIGNGSTEPYSPTSIDASVWRVEMGCCDDKDPIFTEQWQRSRDWLMPFMQNNQPKFLTKYELRSAAMRELNVSKSAFDFGWMAAIEDISRHDWYEPLRRRLRTKS
jgi:hypothetical protein